ncbi:hypothetical protein DOTSEDRAFT_82187 [Dothistroma septosporum NZE10]|uniref:Uncharacterized protein n=1 Tax=Dothistroma septosporum (strain NZE10 / CBS 128990) TaxID=675120 RepID=N1PD80_DOTSN|nr:hypothetical protein DOTSEDRAFT_82187 [Dothistroma septosporum NZE10]
MVEDDRVNGAEEQWYQEEKREGIVNTEPELQIDRDSSVVDQSFMPQCEDLDSSDEPTPHTQTDVTTRQSNNSASNITAYIRRSYISTIHHHTKRDNEHTTGVRHFPHCITLADFLVALPQELFDKIYVLTFSAPKDIRYLDRTACSCGSTAAEQPGSVWIIPELDGRSVSFLVTWLESLAKDRREVIGDVRCVLEQGDEDRADILDRARGRLRRWFMESKVRFGTEQNVTADLAEYRPWKPSPLPPARSIENDDDE